MNNKQTADYQALTDYMWKKIREKPIAVLSTSADDRVTSRPMCIVRIQDDLYFQSDIRMLKFNQMKTNPKIAFCLDNIQMEGVAEFLGPAGEHKDFSTIFKEVHPGSYRSYTLCPNTHVVRCRLTSAQIWKYSAQGAPSLFFLDFKDLAAYECPYDPQSSDSLIYL